MYTRKQEDGFTHIFVEQGETERQVLEAIVRASYILACPTLPLLPNLEEACVLGDRDTAFFVLLDERRVEDSSLVVYMDFVVDHQCSTAIYRMGDNHFRLDNPFFERTRGDFEAVVEVANLMLSTGAKRPDYSNTQFSLRGLSLDLRAGYYGLSRKDGESDWDFRKRIFVELTLFNPIEAAKILFGSSDINNMVSVLAFVLGPEGVELARTFSSAISDGFMNQSRARVFEALAVFSEDPLEVIKHNPSGNMVVVRSESDFSSFLDLLQNQQSN